MAKTMTKEEIIAEKLRQQKLVEEADHKLTEELFGAGTTHAAKRLDGVYDKDTCSTVLLTLPLEVEEHYKILAESVRTVSTSALTSFR